MTSLPLGYLGECDSRTDLPMKVSYVEADFQDKNKGFGEETIGNRATRYLMPTCVVGWSDSLCRVFCGPRIYPRKIEARGNVGKEIAK